MPISLAENALTELATVKAELGLGSASAVQARGTLTLSGLPVAAETFIVSGTPFTAVASGAGDDEFNIGVDVAETLQNIINMFSAGSEEANASAWVASATTAIFEWGTGGVIGNTIAFTESMTNATVDGSGFLGATRAGVDGTSDDDDYLTRQINAASDRISKYCNRVFQWEEDIVEDLAGYGTQFIILSRTPLDSISAIKFDDTALDSDSYEIHDAKAGMLYASGGFVWTTSRANSAAADPFPGYERKSFEATYDGGYITPAQATADPALTRDLPYDLEDACVQLVTLRYRKKGTDPTIKSEKSLSWAASYAVPDAASQPFGIPVSVASVLDGYARLASA